MKTSAGFEREAAANIALFTIEQGGFGLADEHDRRLQAKARVVCVMTIRNGAVVWDLNGLCRSASGPRRDHIPATNRRAPPAPAHMP